MKTKKKRQIIIGFLLIVIAIFFLYYSMREKVYCGIVTNKINGIEYNKHSTTPDPILIVKFDINQEKKEIHCSWITYTECEVNQRVCFEKYINDMEPTWIESGLIGLIACVIIATGMGFILNGMGAFDASTDGPY